MDVNTIEAILDDYQDDISVATDYMNRLYDDKFKNSFVQIFELADKIRLNGGKVSDDVLEEILTSVPLTLIEVSDNLASLEVARQVIKLNIKQKKRSIATDPDVTAGLSKTDITQLQNHAVLEDELIESIYAGTIDLVSRQISYSKELVMSAKKIWDRRRDTERAVPVSEKIIPENLPDYPAKNTYIHG